MSDCDDWDPRRKGAPSAVPDGCSPEIAPSPAQPYLVKFRPLETVATREGPKLRPSTMPGFHPARIGDAFDVMQEQSRRRRPGGAPLFTIEQVAAGRDYAALAERCASSGVRCSSLEAMASHQRSGGGSWIDAVIADGRRLKALRASIGDAVVLSPRGAAAHADRSRRVLRCRALVDQVCIGGRTISQVLAGHGWARNARVTAATLSALQSALDRLGGG